jgi:hypothetical protein
VPQASLRRRRFQLSLAAFGLAVGLIVLLLGGRGAISSVDPGPLSATHAQFTGDAGCSTCHAAHGKGPATWLAQLTAPSRDDKGIAAAHSLAAGCAQCHGFGGDGKQWLAHNREFDKRADVGPTTCTQCHTEHRGDAAKISVASDGQCNACHSVKVHGFAIDHPERARGLVLVASFARYRGNPVIADFWESGVSRLQDPIDPAFVREFQASTLAQAIPQPFLDMVVTESLKVPARVWRDAFEGFLEDDFSDELDAIEAPTLILWGDRDALAPRRDQDIALAAIPDATLIVYEGAVVVVPTVPTLNGPLRVHAES